MMNLARMRERIPDLGATKGGRGLLKVTRPDLT